MSAKRPANSPLSSEFGKKSRLGLSEEKLNAFNRKMTLLHGHVASIEISGVSTSLLVNTFYLVASALQAIPVTALLDESWLDAELCTQRLSQLSDEEQSRLASKWIEARNKGDWERFATHGALRSFH
jgi:hypothetical protein